jgi:hypothetical protein
VTINSFSFYCRLTELKIYFEGDSEQLHRLTISAEQEELERGYWVTTTVKEGPNAPYYFVVPWPPVSRSTIPHGLTLLAVADYLGYLVKLTNNNYRATEENISEFFAKSASYGICPTIHPDQLLLLNKGVRQGIVHNYLPKLDLEISYHSSNPIGRLFFLNAKTNGVVLNVVELRRIVIATFDHILSDGSLTLYQNMEAQYLHAETEYEAQVRTLIQNVKNAL